MKNIDGAEVLDRIALQVGGLIEIYVAETDYDDWSRLVRLLESIGCEIALSELETSASANFAPQLFDSPNDVEYVLTILARNQVWTATISSFDLIYLQGDPREVTSQDDLNNVMQLMYCVSQATSKRVVLVPESLTPWSINPYLAIP